MKPALLALCIVFSAFTACASAPTASRVTLPAEPVPVVAGVTQNDPVPNDPLWQAAVGLAPGTVFHLKNDVCAVGRAKDSDPEIGRETSEFAAQIALVAAIGLSDIDGLKALPHDSNWWFHTDLLTHDTLVCVVPPATDKRMALR